MGLFSDKCPQCGSRVSKRARFCSNCGRGAPDGWVKCPQCGKWVGNDSKFCPHCKTINQYITMADRVYKCGCGYEEDRDTHAARNMIFIKDMVFANSNKLPTEHRKVTLMEFRASIGDVTVSDKLERRSEKMPAL